MLFRSRGAQCGVRTGPSARAGAAVASPVGTRAPTDLGWRPRRRSPGRASTPTIDGAGALERARAADALATPIVLRLPVDGPWEATYDTDLDGDPDLRLVDADHDGWAERQDLRDRAPVGSRGHDPWVPEDGTRVPWLRASYVAWPDDATAERAVRALRSLAP